MASRRFAAGLVALALGASALVVPTQAVAQSQKSRCEEDRRASAEFPDATVGQLSTMKSGQTTSGVRPVYKNGQVEYYFWVTFHKDAEQDFAKETWLNFGFEEVLRDGLGAKNDVFKLEPLPAGAIFPGTTKVQGKFIATDLTTTDKADGPVETIQLDGEKRIVREHTIQNPIHGDSSKEYTYAWKAVSASNTYQERDRTQLEAWLHFGGKKEPLPSQNSNCYPLKAEQAPIPTVIADGKEKATNIVVDNYTASEKDRTNVVVKNNRQVIPEAKTRIDDAGKIFVTLPKGVTGSEDNKKPAELTVEVTVNPHKDALNKPKYKESESLGTHFKLNTQKWNPTYGNDRVKAGGQVTVPLTPGTPRFPDGTTFEKVNAVPNKQGAQWSVEVDPATNALKVTAPADAKKDDNVKVEVRANYPDGSHDLPTSTVTVDVEAVPELHVTDVKKLDGTKIEVTRNDGKKWTVDLSDITSGNVTNIEDNGDGTITLIFGNGKKSDPIKITQTTVTEENAGTPDHTVTITTPDGKKVTFKVFDVHVSDVVKRDEQGYVWDIYRNDVDGGKTVWKTIDLTGIKTELDGLKERITKLEEAGNKSDEEIKKLQDQITNITNNLTEIQNNLENVKNEINNRIDVEIARIEGDISKLRIDLKTIDVRITKIEGRVDDLEDTTDKWAKCYSSIGLLALPAAILAPLALLGSADNQQINQLIIESQKRLGIYNEDVVRLVQQNRGLLHAAGGILGTIAAIASIAYIASQCVPYNETDAMQETDLGKASSQTGSSNREEK
ncbi:Uncharacterised protein [Corynebacterium renale]|uniref:Rib/alpha-like domain-containing protein n=1 Tax=Corynebacterium renale TaxID=1724 RepID=UPI000DA2D9DE|nr:Rib/alpha-like domain-containing protein [Corynebacterium renale]SQG63694.1 Uncharacterised protein [Corynebacterium renale]